MELIEAIRARHSVRKYDSRPIEPEKVAALRAAIDRINAEQGLHIQLALEEPRSFSAGLWKYGQFSGVRNYLVMAGPKGSEAEEKIGFYGEELVLLAQTLGLNTCWVGLSYKKIPGAYTLRAGDIVHCTISLGYGLNAGVQHPLRLVENFYEVDGGAGGGSGGGDVDGRAGNGAPPAWFLAGMEAAILAPTAVNQQKFRFILHPGNLVEAKPLFSLVGYTHIDLGIVKYHFEVGAGKENFKWLEVL